MVTLRLKALVFTSSVALMAGALISQTAAHQIGQSCPPNLVCSPGMQHLVAKGGEQSESFRVLVLTVGFHPCTELRLGLLKQKPGTHAQSSFRTKVSYTVVSGREIRQVSHVSGEIAIRPLAYAQDQIGDIAHELVHVLQLLEGAEPSELDSRECWARKYRNKVVAELIAYQENDKGLEPQP